LKREPPRLTVVFEVTKMNGNTTALPVAKFKAGTVTTALWENQMNINGKTVTVLKATVQRRYKDKSSDEWKSSGSFGRNEIPLAIFCLQKALEEIIHKQNTASQNSGGVPEESVID